MVIPSQNIDCCSHTPAIFGRPLPTAWPHSAFRTWLNARGGTTMSVVIMSDSAAAARYSPGLSCPPA